MQSLVDLKALLKRVIDTEVEPEEAGIKDMQVTFSCMPQISKRELQAEHYRMSHLAAAAKSLSLGSLEMTAKCCLQYIAVLGKAMHNHNFQPMVVSATDIAESALALIHEVENSPTFKKQLSPGPSTSDVASGSEVDENDAQVAALQDKVGVAPDPSTSAQEENASEGGEDSALVGLPTAARETEDNRVSKKRKSSGKLAKKKKKRKAEDKDEEDGYKQPHYSYKNCPLCKKQFSNLPRHIRMIHVERNEKLPLSRVKSLVEMARHGNKVKGGKYTKTIKDGKQKTYKREKYKCFLCDSVVLQLHVHLQRVHKLKKDSDHYEKVLIHSRRYDGQTVELLWDENCIKQKGKQTSKKPMPSTSKEFCKSTDEDSEGEPKITKIVTPLDILAQELSSDTSDEDFEPEPVVSVVPGSPQSGKRCFMTIFPDDREDAPEEEPVEGEVQEDATGEEAGDVEGQGQDEGGNKDEEADGNGGVAVQEKCGGGDEEDVDNDSEEDEGSDEESSDEGGGEYMDEGDDDTSENETEGQGIRTWKEFYSKGNATTLKDQLLLKFCKHLQDILGGCKSERHAIDYAQDVRRIWDTLNAKDDSLGSLLEEGGLHIWRKWAKPLLDAKKVRPGTIRRRLGSINKFFAFIVDHAESKTKGFPELDKETVETIQRVMKRIVAMGTSVNQLYCHERWEQILEDVMNAVNPSDLNRMVETEPAKRALTLLKNSMDGTISLDEAVVVRDFLIARISLENGQRPGPLETARIRDFERLQEKEGKYIMYVSRHKTSKAGPAPITLSANLKSNLQAYLQNVRHILAKKTETAVFTTKSGSAFPAGTIGKRVTAFWQKALGKQQHVTSTKLRKMHASQLYSQDDASKRSAHTLMCHTSRTAEQHYMLNRLADAAVEGHQVLTENIGLTETTPTVVTTSKSANTEGEKTGESDDPETSPGGFTKQQQDDINLLFAHKIHTNGPLSLHETRNFMSESLNLTSLVKDPEMVAKVYKRVKYLQRKYADEGIKAVPEQDSQEKTAEWLEKSSGTSTTKGRFVWSPEDVEVIEKEFSDCNDFPKKAFILIAFRSRANLKSILERLGERRCYEKVKTIYRFNRKK